MRSLLAVFGGLLGGLLSPLALAGPTAWLLLPVHAVFTVLSSVGAVLEGWAGNPRGATRWGGGYVVASLCMVIALEFGSSARGAGQLYWGIPWIAAVAWGWIPPALASGAHWVGVQRRRRLTIGTVARRKRAAHQNSDP